MLGRTIARYRIIEQIGGGGASTVYKAYQQGLDRYVALKILSPYHADKPEFARRFTREARAVARLHHPNILPLYDFGEHEGLRYIAMRYVEGSHTLKQETERAISLVRLVELTGQVAVALDHAHQHGVIHRDVKPSNILIDGKWALLTDFGLAKTPDDSGQLTQSGISVGTPAYMSPEQGQGLPLDHRTDIYSLGTILYEVLTGDVPHNAETPFAIVLKRATEPITMPYTRYPDASETVKEVVLKALAIDPNDRFQSAGALACALRKAVLHTGCEVEAPVRTTKPTTRPTARAIGAALRRARPLQWVARGMRRAAAVLAMLMVLMAVVCGVAFHIWVQRYDGAVPAVTLAYAPPTADPSPTSRSPTYVEAAPEPSETAPLPTPRPAVTADEGLLYRIQVDGMESLHAIRLDGSDDITLTDPAASVSGVFCPAGRRVIVTTARAETVSLQVVDSDGRNPTTLATEVDDGWAVCSADGQRILAAWRKGGAWDAAIMSADGARRVALVSGAADLDVSWDRDWRLAAASYREGDGYAMVLGPLGGGERQTIVHGTNTAYSYRPTLSMDGRWLLYRTYEPEALFSLYLLNVVTQERLPLARGTVYPRGWFAPSGDRLLIAVMPKPDSLFDLHWLDIAAGRSARLLSGDEVGGQFAPDETLIAAWARRDGVYRLYLADLDGGAPLKVLEPGDYAEWQGFSPDGRWVLASVRRNGIYYLYRVHREGAPVEEIVGERQGADWYADGSFSPDGRRLLVTVGRAAPARSSLYLVEPGSGQWTELARDADWQVTAAFTADGKRLVFDSNRGGARAVYVAAADGSRVRWLADGYAPRLGVPYPVSERHHPEPVVPPPTAVLVQAVTPTPPSSTPLPTASAPPASLSTPAAWEITPTPAPMPPPDVPASPPHGLWNAPLPDLPPPTPDEPPATPWSEPVPDTSWPEPPPVMPHLALETSTPRGGVPVGQSVTLGLRNPWGVPGEVYGYDCMVYAPDGSLATTRGMIGGDVWAYLNYPDDFGGAEAPVSGDYRLVCTVETQQVVDYFVVDERILGADTSIAGE
jgi:Tol biopolymer transport system component/tRNA A-37 threonylcarbamoyl transferase component Bud32